MDLSLEMDGCGKRSCRRPRHDRLAARQEVSRAGALATFMQTICSKQTSVPTRAGYGSGRTGSVRADGCAALAQPGDYRRVRDPGRRWSNDRTPALTPGCCLRRERRSRSRSRPGLQAQLPPRTDCCSAGRTQRPASRPRERWSSIKAGGWPASRGLVVSWKPTGLGLRACVLFSCNAR
jgi:hypothetical protein